MCNTCNIVRNAFIGAQSNPQANLIPIHNMLSVLIKQGQLEVYAGDCKFQDMLKVLEEKKHFTVCFYLVCPVCGSIYFLGSCIQGPPTYRKIQSIFKENIHNLIWGSEGSFFNNKPVSLID